MMFIPYIFLSFFLGLICLEYPFLSILVLFIVLFIGLRKRERKFLIVLIPFIAGIIIVLLSRINISSSSFFGIVTDSKKNYIILRSYFSSYYVYIENNPYEVGDILRINGNLEDIWFTNYESQFDFGEYLRKNFVYKEIKLKEINVIFSSFIRIRTILEHNLLNYNDYSKMIIGKLVYNVNLDDQYNSLINENQLFYLLSISSIHVYLLNSIIKKICEIKLNEKTSMVIVIIINSIMYVLSSYKFSILKVLVFSIINFINEYFLKKRRNRVEVISLSGIIILLLKPSCALNISFIYGFSIPYYLVFIQNALSSFKKKHRKYITLFFLFLFIIPINLINNGSFSLTSMILSQMMIPFIFPFFVLSILGILIPLHFFINPLGKLIYRLIYVISKLSIEINIGEISIFFIIIYYLLLIILIYFTENKSKRKGIEVISIISLLLYFYSLPIKNRFSTMISFINVGQGSSTLIMHRGTNVLIDTGGIIGIDIAKETLIPYFKKKRVRRIDYVFITHQDYDHTGALSSLINNFNVIDYNHNNNFSYLKVGDIEFYNLNPSFSNESNDDSLVLSFSINKNRFLIMGDASKEVEKKLITKYDIDCDYLLVGHHGSDTSSNEEFIKKASPTVAIISCGRNNYYNHPSDEVIDILCRNKVEIRRTDIEGTIEYKI